VAAINARANASISTGSPLTVSTIRHEGAFSFCLFFARPATVMDSSAPSGQSLSPLDPAHRRA
jgi:hypothetical protein